MTIDLTNVFSILGEGESVPFFANPLFMMLAIIMMMYFLMIRPQQKARKEQEARIAALKKGDKVVTIGGLHSVVHHISENTVTLKLSEGVFVPYSKTAIQTVTKASSAKDPSDDQETKQNESK